MSERLIRQDWEGRSIDGKIPLLEWLGGAGDRGVFLTVRQGIQKAAIKLFAAGGDEAVAYLAQWEAARALAHPHLMPILEFGRCTVDGIEIVYIITERAEDNLAWILKDRALSPVQAKGVLEPVIEALGFLHGRSVIHGHVKPSNVLAVGGKWKLASDDLWVVGGVTKQVGHPDEYNAPEALDGKLTPSVDAWSMGMTLAVALTQHLPKWNWTNGGAPAVPSMLTPEMSRAIRDCLRVDPRERCTMTQLKLRLDGVAEQKEASLAPEVVAPVVVQQAVEPKVALPRVDVSPVMVPRTAEPKVAPPAEPVVPPAAVAAEPESGPLLIQEVPEVVVAAPMVAEAVVRQESVHQTEQPTTPVEPVPVEPVPVVPAPVEQVPVVRESRSQALGSQGEAAPVEASVAREAEKIVPPAAAMAVSHPVPERKTPEQKTPAAGSGTAFSREVPEQKVPEQKTPTPPAPEPRPPEAQKSPGVIPPSSQAKETMASEAKRGEPTSKVESIPSSRASDQSQSDWAPSSRFTSRDPEHEERFESSRPNAGRMLFALGDNEDYSEEEERPRRRIWPWVLGLVVVLAGAAYVAVQFSTGKPPFAGLTQTANSGSQSPAQTQPAQQAQTQAAPPQATPSSTAPSETNSTGTTPNSEPDEASPTPSEPSQKSANAPAPASSAPAATAPAASPAPATPAADKAATNSAAAADGRSMEGVSHPQKVRGAHAAQSDADENQAARSPNANGEVKDRVVPGVSTAARSSMRRPIEVEIRVAVDRLGTVQRTEYMDYGPGNYFARTAYRAAHDWKFAPPMRDGRPQASVWLLTFSFTRHSTEVTATEEDR